MSEPIPQWVKNLNPGDEIVICFPFAANTIFAHIVTNYPNPDKGAYGTLTIRYTWNGLVREDDLLYDDYNKSGENQNNWYAYHVI